MKRKKRNISLALLLAAAALLVGAGKKKSMPEAYGLVGVSVYHEPGLALRDADVTLVPAPADGETPVKMKKLQGTTDSRGEYVFRVPAATATYKIAAAAKGYRSEEKSVTVHGEERAEVTFMLREESK